MPDMTRASLVIFSHLSEAQELINFSCGGSALENLMFVKYIILMVNNDLNVEIDADAMYKRFTERGKKKSENIEVDV